MFTVRKRSCGKVCFSQAHVENSVHRGGGGVHSLGRHPTGQTPVPLADTPQADGCCSGRYASYWNAFLFGKKASTETYFAVRGDANFMRSIVEMRS